MHDIVALWINVDSHTERAQFMTKELNRVGIRNERISAITPSTLPPIIRKDNDWVTDLEIACMCSHLKSYLFALEKYPDIEFFIILEDDMVFLEELPKFSQLIEEAPDDAHCFQLFSCNPDVYPEFLVNNHKGEKWLPHKPHYWGANAYLISRAAMNINLWTFFEDGKTVDLRPAPYPTNPEAIVYSHLNAYTLTTPIFLTRDIESTIHNDHTTDFYYSNFMVKQIRKKEKEYVFLLDIDNNLIDELNKEHYIHIFNNIDEVENNQYSMTGANISYSFYCTLLVNYPDAIYISMNNSHIKHENICILTEWNDIYKVLKIPKRIFRK
jgi:hypothetical protein